MSTLSGCTASMSINMAAPSCSDTRGSPFSVMPGQSLISGQTLISQTLIPRGHKVGVVVFARSASNQAGREHTRKQAEVTGRVHNSSVAMGRLSLVLVALACLHCLVTAQAQTCPSGLCAPGGLSLLPVRHTSTCMPKGHCHLARGVFVVSARQTGF